MKNKKHNKLIINEIILNSAISKVKLKKGHLAENLHNNQLIMKTIATITYTKHKLSTF